MSDETFLLHRFLRGISSIGAASFFTEVKVIGGEHVPKEGPIIVAATHHNMMVDPLILSTSFPHGRLLSYWSKASLYANPIMRQILLSTCNIPVDRKSKDRSVLLRGTFEALDSGRAVALFPEGTSYTEPRIMQVKDGVSWALLEYTKLRERRDVVVIPAAIVYTNKSKYRSSVIMEFGKPISPDPFIDQFLGGGPDDARAAVKRLTKTIEQELVQATVNAPDWDTLFAARMARDLLFPSKIDLSEFTLISQTLVDLFTQPTVFPAPPHLHATRTSLLRYYSLLHSTHLTNDVLSNLPLPRTLSPRHPTPLPSRLYTLILLTNDTITASLRLPFFLVPLLLHLPIYILGRLGARLVEDEEETLAQNKLAFGVLAVLLVYPAFFIFLWGLMWYSRWGLVLAGAVVWALVVYHIRTINDNYLTFRRLIAAWRVLVGTWAPKRWEFSLSALSQYTKLAPPKENPFIDKPKSAETPTPPVKRESDDSTSEEHSHDQEDIPRVLPPQPHLNLPGREEPTPMYPGFSSTVSLPNKEDSKEDKERKRKNKRPPSRRIMRHVLRARVEAIRSLAGFFDGLSARSRTGSGQGQQVYASGHLARRFGGLVDVPLDADAGVKGEEGAEGEFGAGAGTKREGWRQAEEVVRYLRERGAKIPSARAGRGAVGSGETSNDDWEWVALSSDADA